MKPLDVLIIGAGGYGGQYLGALLSAGPAHGLRIAGIAEPFPESVLYRRELEAMGCPWYDTAEEFYREHTADLALISSPIEFHKKQAMLCLSHGSHVLCEKPLCSTVEDLEELIRARDESGKLLAVGYQWTWADTVQAFKRDAIAGRFGKLISMKTLIRWPRDTAYFSRGIGWAGKLRASDGTWVLDSIAHNACGHYLHHMLFTAGKTMTGCALPVRVQSTLLRVNRIENFDTAFIQAYDEDGVSYLFLASHAVEENVNPVFRFTYENAEATYIEDDDAHIHVRFADGTQKDYGGMGERSDMGSIHYPKLWHMAEAIRGTEPLCCPPEAAMGHTMAINAAQISCPVRDFPAELVQRRQMSAAQNYVPGLEKLLLACYEENRLPGENDPEWARPGRTVNPADCVPFAPEVL